MPTSEGYERIADIVAEMREPDVRANSPDISKRRREVFSLASDWLADYADRIEVAWKRERDEVKEGTWEDAEAQAQIQCRDCVAKGRRTETPVPDEDGAKEVSVRAPLPWRVSDRSSNWAILDANGNRVATVDERFFAPGGHALGVAETICMGVNHGLGPSYIVFHRDGGES